MQNAQVTLSGAKVVEFINRAESPECNIIKMAAFASWSGFTRRETIRKNYNGLSELNAVRVEVREEMKKALNSRAEQDDLDTFLETSGSRSTKGRKGAQKKPQDRPQGQPQEQPPIPVQSSPETRDSEYPVPIPKKCR
ncbi:hypothetical protein BGX31_000709, partial [Mortierella sp. GBA43]